ncbi:hypothetical protein RhiJN_22678 [Ceratobasidium sp. AG-Ba]|nr:hypothetical protein RhiJN_22678 [Ceratobasidium sp. AG-Ba]
MRSLNVLAFLLLAIFSVFQLAFAEPIPTDDLVARGTNSTDIAPSDGPVQQPINGGSSGSNAKSDKHICPEAIVAEIGSVVPLGIGAIAASAALVKVTDATARDAVARDGTAARVANAARLAIDASGSGVGFAAAPMASSAPGKRLKLPQKPVRLRNAYTQQLVSPNLGANCSYFFLSV